jgi:hypothetical protein
MSTLKSIRNRTIFFGVVVLLIAIWVMKAALNLAGAAIKIVVIIAVVLIAIGWISTKVGRGR